VGAPPPPSVPSNCAAPSLLPRGLRPSRSGGVSSAALRPACACDRAGQSGGRSLAVSFAALRTGVSTRRSGRSGPARSGAIGLRPLGGLAHPPLRHAEVLLCFFGVTTPLGPQQDLRVVGGGDVNPPVPRGALGPPRDRQRSGGGRFTRPGLTGPSRRVPPVAGRAGGSGGLERAGGRGSARGTPRTDRSSVAGEWEGGHRAPRTKWSGKRDLNPRLRPWQGRTLPLSYSRSAQRPLARVEEKNTSVRRDRQEQLRPGPWFGGKRTTPREERGIRRSAYLLALPSPEPRAPSPEPRAPSPVSKPRGA
jgi:hypothetical protein